MLCSQELCTPLQGMVAESGLLVLGIAVWMQMLPLRVKAPLKNLQAIIKKGEDGCIWMGAFPSEVGKPHCWFMPFRWHCAGCIINRRLKRQTGKFSPSVSSAFTVGHLPALVRSWFCKMQHADSMILTFHRACCYCRKRGWQLGWYPYKAIISDLSKSLPFRSPDYISMCSSWYDCLS